MMSTPVIHNVSLSLCRQWDIFRQMDDEAVYGVTAFHSFTVPPHNGCTGGRGAIFLTVMDEAFGSGHNCNHINILGLSSMDPLYREDEVSGVTKICGLSNKYIKQISVGSLIGAAVTESGVLYWWGNCYRHSGEVATPHTPRCGRRKFITVSCGHRMMAGLASSNIVFVWGFIYENSRFLDGDRVTLDSPITQLTCGLNHLAMLDSDGSLFTWGGGNEGQRGFDNFSPKDLFVAKKVLKECCKDVKCGPYSTLCLTESCELMVCGSNQDLHLGHVQDSNTVNTFSIICVDGAVTNIAVVPQANHTSTMIACTSDGDFYIWGTKMTPFPTLAEGCSFMEIFASLKSTPEFTYIGFPAHVDRLEISPTNHIETHNDLMADVLIYVYLKDRPDMYEPSGFFWQGRSQDIENFAHQITNHERGSDFVLQKYLMDLRSKEQVLPELDNLEDYPIFSNSYCLGRGTQLYV